MIDTATVVSIFSIIIAAVSLWVSVAASKEEKKRAAFNFEHENKGFVTAEWTKGGLRIKPLDSDKRLQCGEIVFPSSLLPGEMFFQLPKLLVDTSFLEMRIWGIIDQDKASFPTASYLEHSTGIVTVPVIITTQYIVKGSHIGSRGLYALKFDYKLPDKGGRKILKFSALTLVSTLSIPVKEQLQWRQFPFVKMKPLEERVLEQDRRDMQDLLNERWEVVLKSRFEYAD